MATVPVEAAKTDSKPVVAEAKVETKPAATASADGDADVQALLAQMNID